uniref:C-type lectin domain-containing protein n=1 Tax=Acrobeloides nanus TaxID=290746 RepID=A0A914CA65_9BILA
MSQIAVGILVQLQTSQWYPQIDNYVFSRRHVIVTKALIGLQYNSVKNSWEWMDGTPFDYANWLTGYPSNKSISTSVVEINMQLNYNNGYNKWANDQNNPYDGDYFFCQSPGMAPSQKR